MADITYSAEFSVTLDKLKKGIVETRNTLDELVKMFEEQGKKAGEGFDKKVTEGLEKAKAGPGESYGKNLAASIEQFIPGSVKKISGLFESIAPKWADAGKKAAMGFAKSLGKLVPAAAPVIAALIQSSGGLLLVIGAIALAIKAIATGIKKAHDEQEAFNKAVKAQKDALENAKRAIESINDASETAAKNYRAGERAAAAQHLIWKKFGDWVSNKLKPVLEGIKDTFTLISNGIGFVANALGFISNAEVAAAIEAQKLESSYNGIDDAATEYARTIKEINMDSTKGDKEKLAAAQSYLDALIEQRVVMAEMVGDASQSVKEIDELIAAQTTERDRLAETVKETGKTEKEQTNLLEQAEKQYAQTLLSIQNQKRDGMIGEEEALNRKLQAEQEYVQTLSRIRDEYHQLGALGEEQAENVREIEQAHALQAKALEEQIKAREKQKEIDKALADAALERVRAEQEAEDAKQAGLISQEEYQKEIEQALERQYAAVEAIVVQYGLSANEAGRLRNELAEQVRLNRENAKAAENRKQIDQAMLDMGDELAQQAVERERELASSAKTEEEKNEHLRRAVELENEITQTIRDREKARIMDSEAFKSASEREREIWLANFDAITEGMMKIHKIEAVDPLKNVKEGLSLGVGYFEDAASSVLSITQSMAQDQIDTINNLLEEQKELIDAQYEETMARLDEERQKALEMAGFVKTVTEEGLAASMEAAMASGDEKAIYEEKRRQEELAINQKYDALEKEAEDKRLAETKAAEEKAAREIAEIQYRQAMAEWVMKLAAAPGQVASAILATFGETGFFGISLTPVVAALGALQIAAIAAAIPRKPAFKYGGIVGMPETYNHNYRNGGIVSAAEPLGADSINATLSHGEIVANPDHIENVWDMMNGKTPDGGGGTVNISIAVILDGEMLAQNSVNYINSGATEQIEARMVAR